MGPKISTIEKNMTPAITTSSHFDRFATKSAQLIAATPVEGVAFLVASIAVRLFSTSLTAPLLGIGLSIIATRVVLKIVEWYDQRTIVFLNKEACKLKGNYPNLEKVSFCFSLAVSFISKPLGFVAGALLGCFGSIILDVENYKLMQKQHRTLYRQQQA
jgi:hypothetical protein